MIVNGKDEQWQADLVDVQSLKKDNDGYRFLLTVIGDFTNQNAMQFENTETEKGPGRERRHERGKNKVTDANATTETKLCKSFKLR